MVTTPILNVCATGLTRQDECVLRSLFAITSNRSNYNYRLLESGESAPPDIEIVGLKNPANEDTPPPNTTNAALPTILVGNENTNKYKQLYICRPLTLSKVMGVLARAANNLFGGAGNVKISDDQSLELLNIHTSNTKEDDSKNNVVTQNDHVALVVDDSPSIRKLMEIQLLSLGTKVVFAHTGEKALMLLEQQSFDIIFLDVVLPGVDGYHVCRVIKNRSEYKSIPVCMLTSKSSTFNRVKGTLCGCDVYLTKPIQAKKLKGLIAKYITVK